MSPLKLGIFQFDPVFGEVETNLERIESALKDVDADIMVLPELCTTGYQFTSVREAEALCEVIPDGPSVQALIQMCKELNIHLVAGIGEKEGEALYNSAVLIGPDGLVGKYRKVHLFLNEKEWFRRGEAGFHVWDIGSVRIGMMICFDWIFPEAARTLALKGADVICHPSNLVLPYCPQAMITRSIENRVYTATANRTGFEERIPGSRLVYIGQSQVISPKGEILFRMGQEESLQIAEVRTSESRAKQITPKNHLYQDRLPSLYELQNPDEEDAL